MLLMLLVVLCYLLVHFHPYVGRLQIFFDVVSLGDDLQSVQ
jgi:hypothetical protein